MFAFTNMKYGVFIHYIALGCMTPEGVKVDTWDESVNNFDVERFADEMAQMKPEYAIFTAWHYAMRPLYPSEVTEKWRPGSSSLQRDLLGEIIDALNKRSIQVILYTHPRDGHDIPDEEKDIVGWGKGQFLNFDQTPNPDTFNYERWNTYIQELYAELIDRYGRRIIGIYTDGMGAFNSSLQVVNYPALRNVIKSKNPKLFMIQNYWGHSLSNDYVMPEAFFGYEHKVNDQLEKLPACNKALAICPFNGWSASAARGENIARMSAEKIAMYTLFNASCTVGGGCCWAYGPFNDGSLETGVLETLGTAGDIISRYSESVMKATPSASLPTMSGDTLESRNFVFYTTSADRTYEYMNILKMPEDKKITFPESEDGIMMYAPESLDENIKIASFNGKTIILEGNSDEFMTVIRFKRVNYKSIPIHVWVNNTDKRFKYNGLWEFNELETWKYRVLDTKEPSGLGCYEADYQFSDKAGDSVFFAFEGSRIAVYGIKSPAGGKADVFIDGSWAGEIDQYAPERSVRELCFRSDNLFGGWHTLEIVLTANKLFTFDAVKISNM